MVARCAAACFTHGVFLVQFACSSLADTWACGALLRRSSGAATAKPTPIIKIDNQTDAFATKITIDVGDQLGEMLDTVRTSACLSGSGSWEVIGFDRLGPEDICAPPVPVCSCLQLCHGVHACLASYWSAASSCSYSNATQGTCAACSVQQLDGWMPVSRPQL